MSGWRFICALAFALSSFAPATAQEEDDEPYLPGLVAEFRQPKSKSLQRLENVVAANWTTRPDERLRPGEPFTVIYRGVLDVPDDGNYALHLHGNGKASVLLNGEAWLANQQLAGWASSRERPLKFGPLTLEIHFTVTTWPARLGLFWSSDRFEREPVPARVLKHAREIGTPNTFEQGQVLSRALRCEACHAPPAKINEPMPAPALDQLTGNLHRAWLVNWLRNDGSHDQFGDVKPTIRRMPFLNIPAEEAELLADWLLGFEAKKKEEKEPKPDSKKKPRTNAELLTSGQHLIRTKGCLACHELGEFGESGLFGGGDLTNIATKRPREFFDAWLQKPEALNRDHRMPVFDLTADEREALSLFLSEQKKGDERRETRDESKERKARARELARKYRCDECHRLPEQDQVLKLPTTKAIAELTAKSNWDKSCVQNSFKQPQAQPMFRSSPQLIAALKKYFSERIAPDPKVANKPDGAQLVIENNCLACHAREPQLAGVLPKKFADKLVQLAAADPELAPQLPALTPPSLNSVGDKLTDAALSNAITRAGPAHRPYLQVQMPRFRFSKEQVEQVSEHFIDVDRIPDYPRSNQPAPTAVQLAARALAGKRLVGTDGFSCTACHQVGSVQPVKAPPNARGPTLSLPQNRLRKTWFDRWVRNPARIVPRMEMPSVQTPVRGVLQDNLPEQLAAVWQVLSTPGFEPPPAEAVRTLRFYSNEDNRQQQPLTVTDLIEYDGATLERAALIGFPNRQNILFDFATHRLLSWTQGDLARQRTKGKNWYWEPAGSPLLTTALKEPEFGLEVAGKRYEMATMGQWFAEPWRWELRPNSAMFEYVVTFREVDVAAKAKEFDIHIRQTITPYEDATGRGLRREFTLRRLPKDAMLVWRLANVKEQTALRPIHELGSVRLQQEGQAAITIEFDREAKVAYRPEGTVALSLTGKYFQIRDSLDLAVRYTTPLAPDEYHVPRPPPLQLPQPTVTIAPGFTGERLSLPTDIMPTALTWFPNGDLAVASLKGQVMAFTRDSLKTPQPKGDLIADGLAAPYGLQATTDHIYVATKSSLIRFNLDQDFGYTSGRTAASGWGYTSDYHDWCVGLPKDATGNFYLALPCFQDNRAEPAKRWRGAVLKLKPDDRPQHPSMQPFEIEVISRGHRFPMGMALNKNGELFVTDNQGNYNPFNELNHVQKDKHFGFVNKGREKPTELTQPAIDIPHPWTRSVNGICFLNTPVKSASKNIFGPLEGQLVGCEYDTRRLIRLSLQEVDGEYQGCAYPLTIPTPAEEAPLGPVCCEVSPAGELFIGSIRDSGWGAGNNIGEVIRVKVDPTQFGSGLAEMRAIAHGFELHFFAPVVPDLAEQLTSYTLSSYRRESTPAYGGNDIDRRTEKIAKVVLSADRKRVTLSLDQLRTGHVYELRLKSLAPENEMFFPAEAHYTLRRVPK